ncbi:MAG: hypothetical protein M1826_002813 [Phylliscum demangeonii]|nr:MAG: hypothetical protein M1826_002813 [Phylliscum demangeonii]
MDLLIKVGQEARVAIEVKRDFVFMAHPVELDSTVLDEWLGWDGCSNATGLRSIILKGVVATERQCRVFRVQYARIDGEYYPYLLMGDPMPVDSSSPAILGILVYMVLTGVDALPGLYPPPPDLKIPADLYTYRGRPPANPGAGGAANQAQENEGGIALDLNALVGQPSTMYMTRAHLNPASLARGHRTIQVQSVLGSGVTGVCLRGVMGHTAVVIKFEQTGQREALKHEAEVYEHVLSNMASSSSDLLPAPRYFGYFEDRDDRRAVVMEYAGPALQSFDELTVKAK